MIYDEIDTIEEDDRNRELNTDDEDFDEERLPAIETEIIRDEDQEQCVIWVVFWNPFLWNQKLNLSFFQDIFEAIEFESGQFLL